MATFNGTVTAISALQSGTSKAGKEWKKIDVVLTYDNTKPEYPKAIVFSVMNDNIDKFGFQVGGEYEVEIDFSVREYQGRRYMSASAWKATAKITSQAAVQGTNSATQAQTQEDDGGLPF